MNYDDHRDSENKKNDNHVWRGRSRAEMLLADFFNLSRKQGFCLAVKLINGFLDLLSSFELLIFGDGLHFIFTLYLLIQIVSNVPNLDPGRLGNRLRKLHKFVPPFI